MIREYLLFILAYFVFSSASFGEDPGAFADILGPYQEAGLHTCLNFWFWYEVSTYCENTYY